MEVGEMTCSTMTVSNSGSGETSTVSSSSHQVAATASATPLPPIVTKKKRNLPGMPDPDAEVISLSPRTLMATNRFVCEICNKGFQRDQNLQLHRRGHNLPWKLRQRNSKEVKKRVYVCPETSCIHHDPSRALGDLTGIKKHFCRKHGEKKWKCDKCSKKYAVQSDWKAHSKTCGTREYRCDCGTLFSRRDSFITHRAFCDALAEESAKVVVVPSNAVVANSGTSDEDPMVVVPSPRQQTLPPPISPPPAVARLPVIEQQQQQQKELESRNTSSVLHHIPPPQPPMSLANGSSSSTRNTTTASSACTTTNTSLFATLFSSAAPSQTSTFSDLIGAMSDSDRGGFAPQPPLEPISLCLSATVPVNIFSSSTGPHDRRTSYGPPPPPSPHMSATALLQKAAQMGSAATNTSLLRGFGLSTSTANTSSTSMNNHLYPCQDERYDGNYEWRNDSSHFDLQESHGLSSGLGLALQYGAGGLPEFSSMCGAKPATLDFLGLGMGPAGSGAGLSAMMTSISSGGFEMGGLFGSGSGKSTWDGNGMERKPSSPARL